MTVDATRVDELRTQFGRHVRTESIAPDGTARVRVAAATSQTLARRLAGWGAALHVEDPPDVRAELVKIGLELVSLDDARDGT